MAELKFPVTELDKDKFQVVVDMSLYTKESLIAACYKFTGRFFVHQQTEGDSVCVVFESKEGHAVSEETVKQFSSSSAMNSLTNRFVTIRICSLAIYVI